MRVALHSEMILMNELNIGLASAQGRSLKATEKKYSLLIILNIQVQINFCEFYLMCDVGSRLK